MRKVLNGAKTFIPNGVTAAVNVLVVKTDPSAGARVPRYWVLETADAPRYRVGRVLDKVGMKAQDTAELFFDNVRLPVANLLGEEGKGFGHAITSSHARIVIADRGIAVLESAVAER